MSARRPVALLLGLLAMRAQAADASASWDRLKALMKKDRVRHDVSFPRQPLLDATEGDPPAEVVNTLRDLLQPYL